MQTAEGAAISSHQKSRSSENLSMLSVPESEASAKGSDKSALFCSEPEDTSFTTLLGVDGPELFVVSEGSEGERGSVDAVWLSLSTRTSASSVPSPLLLSWK